MFPVIRKLSAVVLFFEDLERAMKFYRDTLGMEVVFTDEASYALRLDGQDFALLKMSAAADMLSHDTVSNAGNRSMLCADVDDVDAVYEALIAKGLAFIQPPTDQHWGLRTAFFADPEGHLWQIAHSIK